MTSLRTREAIAASRSDRFIPASMAAASPMGREAMSAIEWSSIVTASAMGLSRAPPHAAHGTSRMKPSKRSRLASVSASLCRR